MWGDTLWLEPIGPWIPSHVDFIRSRNIDHLRISYANDCNYPDTRFLHEITHLRSLDIAQIGSIDLEGIETLNQLEQLRLHVYGKAEVDLSLFTRLRKLDLAWKKTYTHLEACSQISDLCLLSPDVQVHASIECLHRLEKLSLFGSSRTDLLYLPSSIESLRLTRCVRVRDITRLSSLSRLKYLWVQESRSFEPLVSLGTCVELERVVLEDMMSVRSVDPFLALKHLELLRLDTRVPLESSEILKLDSSTIANIVVSSKNRILFERHKE